MHLPERRHRFDAHSLCPIGSFCRNRTQQTYKCARTTLHVPCLSPIFSTHCRACPALATMFNIRAQKRRRTATSVFAGDFDPRPQRDVLTSLLNGVPVYKAVEKAEEEEERRTRKKEKKEREKDKKRAKALSKPADKPNPVPSTSTASVPVAASSSTAKRPAPPPRTTTAVASTSSFWQARPTINIATLQRSRSETPPLMPSSPPTTPGPSISSSTSATSSKRPRTPDDGEEFTDRGRSVATASPPPKPAPQRKKRAAARKGWKGWVEGSPPPSQKLINLDVVDVIPGERKTRSGKSFDAIGVGKDSWV